MTLALNDTNITGSTSGMTLNNIASINGGQLAGFRNKIINGNMGIYQRGTTPVTTTGTYGPADRYLNTNIGNTFSTTQGSFVSGDVLFDTGGAQYFTQIAVTSVTGASNLTHTAQRIEDVRILAGKTVTVSFWARATSGTPSIGISIDQRFGTGGSVAAEGVGQAQLLTSTWTKYRNTFTVPSIAGKTIGTENTHFTQLVFWLNAGSDLNTRSGSIGQSSKTVSIAQVQLEEGSVDTPFEFRPIGTELSLCQRYYYRASSATFIANAYCATTVSLRAYMTFPIPLRIAPTALEQSGVAGNYSATVAGATITLASVPTFDAAGQDGATFLGTVASGFTAGQAAVVRINSGGYLGWSAEL